MAKGKVVLKEQLHKYDVFKTIEKGIKYSVYVGVGVSLAYLGAPESLQNEWTYLSATVLVGMLHNYIKHRFPTEYQKVLNILRF